jgi:hypothetical protein
MQDHPVVTGALAALLALGVFGLLACEQPAACHFGEMTELAGDKTDKGVRGHHFTEIYEHLFFPLKEQPIRILEIGVAGGGSLTLWRDYFPGAKIFGIDILDRSELDTERIRTFVADQASREQLQRFIDTHGSDYDIILDDGGHTMEQQQTSFGYLFPHVKPGGYYVIEDVHTSLPMEMAADVDPDGANTTLTMIQGFITSGTLRSSYLSTEENRYLTREVEYCNLFVRQRGNSDPSITAIFRKRNG